MPKSHAMRHIIKQNNSSMLYNGRKWVKYDNNSKQFQLNVVHVFISNDELQPVRPGRREPVLKF